MVTTKERFDKFLDDSASRKALIDQMLPALREEYQSYRFVGKEAAFPGRVLVVYTLEGLRPVHIDMITLSCLTIGQESGPLAYAASEGQGEYPIGMVPTKWRGRDLFLQLPLEFIFKWKGKTGPRGVEFASHYAILIKARSRVDEQIESHTYCETLNDFRARFPGVPIRY